MNANDSWNWGNNCRLLGYDTDTTQKCVEAFFPDYPNRADYDFDSFWDGYFCGTNTKIVSLPPVSER